MMVLGCCDDMELWLDLNTTIQSAKGPQIWMYTLKGLIREMHAA